MNPKLAVSKELSAKHIKVLEGLLKLPENKECADCRSRAPRWTSINLGIFICLQCSGIHRSLGVHISKVRSATLDTWHPEQVAFMQSMGNEKSNAYWEADLPLHHDRGRIENFIRAKYVEKRWIPNECKVKSPPISKQGLGSGRSSSRRFGCIAEWTNNQHLFKGRTDCSKGEKDEARSSPVSGEERKDCTENKNQHLNQPLEKKEICQASMDQTASDLKNVNIAKEQPHVPNLIPNGSLRKSEHEFLEKEFSTANLLPAVPNLNVDYADELFKTLCMDDSADNGSSPYSTSAWVQFDSDIRSSIPEAKIVLRPVVEEALIHEAKLTPKLSASKVNPIPKEEDAHRALVLFTRHVSEDQKDVTKDTPSLSEKANMVSASSSIHLQRLAALAQGVPSTDASNFPGSNHHQNIKSFQAQQNASEGSVIRATGTEMATVNIQPVKLAVNPAAYTVSSSLYTPEVPFKGVPTAPTKRPPAALPVSGYDYDFSFLTQGMFTRR